MTEDHERIDELLAGYVLLSLSGEDAAEADRVLIDHVPSLRQMPGHPVRAPGRVGRSRARGASRRSARDAPAPPAPCDGRRPPRRPNAPTRRADRGRGLGRGAGRDGRALARAREPALERRDPHGHGARDPLGDAIAGRVARQRDAAGPDAAGQRHGRGLRAGHPPPLPRRGVLPRARPPVTRTSCGSGATGSGRRSARCSGRTTGSCSSRSRTSTCRSSTRCGSPQEAVGSPPTEPNTDGPSWFGSLT